MEIRIKKLHPSARLPEMATAGAACFDLHAIIETDTPVHVDPGWSTVFPTGLAVEIPDGYAMLVFSRSGHGFKQNTRLSNCVGVIDSDYRGEVCVKLTRDETEGPIMTVKHLDRIAQAMIIAVPKVSFTEVDELSDTARGAGGFGSTGQSDNGWIAWGGGLRPVSRHTMVDVVLRDGTKILGKSPTSFYWERRDRPADIVHYRVVTAQQPDTPEAR